jgi:lysylphosphatidylglycerol synthetase-like protein (DUF2156 family)
MPVSEARLQLVETVLPLGVVEISHPIGSIAGVSLLLLVYGADSDDVARLFRDHVARCSDMMSPA